jgi:hypothetical protein
MTRDEMPKRLELSGEELKELLQKFEKFHKSLNDRQRAVIDRSLPTTAAAAKTFGPTVTPAHLQQLFSTNLNTGMFVMRAARHEPNLP